jgi:hypothetical protein
MGLPERLKCDHSERAERRHPKRLPGVIEGGFGRQEFRSLARLKIASITGPLASA